MQACDCLIHCHHNEFHRKSIRISIFDLFSTSIDRLFPFGFLFKGAWTLLYNFRESNEKFFISTDYREFFFLLPECWLLCWNVSFFKLRFSFVRSFQITHVLFVWKKKFIKIDLLDFQALDFPAWKFLFDGWWTRRENVWKLDFDWNGKKQRKINWQIDFTLFNFPLTISFSHLFMPWEKKLYNFNYLSIERPFFTDTLYSILLTSSLLMLPFCVTRK